jgi:hypothetical protein
MRRLTVLSLSLLIVFDGLSLVYLTREPYGVPTTQAILVNIRPWKPYSLTVDLLVLTSLDQQIFYIENVIFLFY